MSTDGDALLQISFEATVIYWRGPAPFFYAPIPDDLIEDVRKAARIATYGWGCVPVEAEVGGVAFTTALFPKDGTYLLPLKVAVRRKTNITAGDAITAEMTIRQPHRAGSQWSPV
jgi:hypothetical protein